MDYTEESLTKLKESFDESIDSCMSKEEIDLRWSKYRRVFQKMLKDEYKKIDRRVLTERDRCTLKRFKNCFFSSNVAFRRMQRMLQTDIEVRELLKKYSSINQYICFFESGYNISNN